MRKLSVFRTLKSIVGILLEREQKQPEIVVSLDELCQIWLPYNNSFHCSQVQTEPDGEAMAGAPPDDLQHKDENPEGSEFRASESGVDAGRKLIKFNMFYDEIIEPYRSTFFPQGVLDDVDRVIEMLNRYGDCPSIITEGLTGSETGASTPIRDALLKVNLRDHTFRVAKNALKLMKEVYNDASGMTPVTIIAALCHDIGKMPHLRAGQAGYSKDNHPILSAQFVEKNFRDNLNPYLLNLVTTAVKNHHLPTTDQFTTILKEADSMARTAEVAKNSANKAQEWAAWFDTTEFLSLIKPHVNIIQAGALLKTFSASGTVYCDPTFMYELAGKLAAGKKIIEMSLLREEEKEMALRKIVEFLRESGCLSAELGRGYIVRKYEVQFDNRKKALFFIPVNLNAFERPEEIEEVKKTHPPVINGIKPL